MKKHLVIAALMVLAVSILTSHSWAAEPIRIGAPVLLSGAGAHVGGGAKDTLEMKAAGLNKAGGINGRPIEFIFYDEEAKPDVAVNLVKRLIHKRTR